MLDILVLGAVEARAWGRVIPLGGVKQRVLVARLAMEMGRPLSVDRLIDELWDENLPRDPVHALQAQVSRLRSALPADIELLDAGYRLDPAAIRTDTADFVKLCERGRQLLADGVHASAAARLREALGLWRGPAFAGLPDMAALRAESVWLDKLRASATADRVDADLASGNGATTAVDLYALVEQHPLAERHWGQLMTALYCGGQANEALEVFSRARATFADHLGTEPTAELGRLHQAILQDEPPESLILRLSTGLPERDLHVSESALRDVATKSLPPPQSVLAGREREMTVLERAWSEAQHGLKVVTITGEPGIGKTHLVRELASRLEPRQASVLLGRCDETLDIAYQPLIEMLRADLHGLSTERLIERLGPYPAELARLLPDLVARLPPDLPVRLRSDPDTEQHRLFEAVAGWLSASSLERQLCLVVDDLQWSGPEMSLLLQYLLTAPQRLRVLVLVTYRDRHHAPTSSVRYRFSALLRQSETLTHLPLDALDEGETVQLVTTELVRSQAVVPDRLAESVAEASGGNPLFALELARHYAGLLTDGHNVDAQDIPRVLPAGLHDVIGRRLERVPAAMRQTLEYAAVGGRIIDPSILMSIPDCTTREIDEFLTTARHGRLIEAAMRPWLSYAFCHEVIRIAVYEDISPLRRAEMHLRVAQAIERRYGASSRRHYHELGYHYARAIPFGSATPAVHYLTLAADRSLEQRAPAAAADLYRSAVELLPADSDAGALCDLMTWLGTAELRSGSARYRETLLAAAQLARDAGDARRLTAAAIANSRGWYSSTAAVDTERVAVIEAALVSCDVDDRRARTQLLGSWALENIRDPSRRPEAIARSTEALALAEQLGDDVLLGHTLSHHYAVLYASFSDPHGCAELCVRLRALAEARADPGLALTATISQAQATMMLGDFRTADAALARAAQLGEQLKQPTRLWMIHGWQAMAVAMRGDLDGAEALATAAVEQGIRTEQPDAQTWYAGQLFTLRMLAGRLDELIDTVEDQVTAQAGGIPAWRAAYALTLTTVHRLDEADAILDEFLADGLAQLPLDMLWLHGMSYLCGVCAAIDRPDAAKKLYDTLEPYSGLLAHNGTIDAGPVDLHLGTMARVAGDDVLAAKHLTASITLCEDIDAPLWKARAQVQLQALPA